MKILKYILPLLVIGMLVGLPAFAAIKSPEDVANDATLQPPSDLQNTSLSNANMDTITQTIVNLRNWFAGIILIIAVLVILIGAFMYMTSGGDATKTGKARGWIIGGIVGIIIAAIAFGIFGMVSGIITQVTSN